MRQNGHLIHGMTALLTSYGFYSQALNADFVRHISKTFAGPFEFLTILTAMGTILYAFVAISTIYFPKMKRPRIDLLSIVMSIECAISLAFWSVYAYDPQLLFVTEGSRLQGAYLNPIIDACLHLFPAIGLLLEFFLHIDYPHEDFRRHQRLITGACTGYTTWLLFLRWVNGNWVYPVLSIFPVWFLFILFPFNIYMVLSIFSKLVSWKLVLDRYIG
jgi:hypothetical protein